jgi:hypothetical protein
MKTRMKMKMKTIIKLAKISHKCYVDGNFKGFFLHIGVVTNKTIKTFTLTSKDQDFCVEITAEEKIMMSNQPKESLLGLIYEGLNYYGDINKKTYLRHIDGVFKTSPYVRPNGQRITKAFDSEFLTKKIEQIEKKKRK